MEKELRRISAELLKQGDVKLIIGYGWNKRKTRVRPVFVTEPEDIGRLVFNPLCVNNLSVYLTRKFKDIQAIGRPAIVAKGCDIKTIAVLMAEKQVFREKVTIIGMVCNGVVCKQETWNGEIADHNISSKCLDCKVRNPHIFDYKIGDNLTPYPIDGMTDPVFNTIRKLDKASSGERWSFWMQHFSRCVRCYACSKVCPLCYCERCIAEKNMPQWVESSAHKRGNLAWNLTRAMHLVGRCTYCGECERSCPVNIPLNLINQKMSLVVKDSFDHESGYDESTHPPLIVFSPDDRDDFIK